MSEPDARALTFRQTGSAKQVLVWVLVALTAGGLVAAQLYDSGASDPSFVIAMSIAVIVAIVIVAPRKFSSLDNLVDLDGNFDDAPYERDRRGLPPEGTEKASQTELRANPSLNADVPHAGADAQRSGPPVS